MDKPDTFAIPPLTFPCLFLDAEAWEHLSDKLQDPFFHQLHEHNMLALEDMMSEAPRPHSRALKNRLQRAVVAWYITHDEKYLTLAKQALEACCQHKELWWFNSDYVEGLRAADLSTGEMLYNVAFGYDALYPYLPESLKQRCLDTLIHEGLAAYQKGIELHDWWVNCDFNWNSALHGNAGLAALVVRETAPELSDQVLRTVLQGLPAMIAAFYPDGGYIEGVMYFNTAIGHLTDFIAPYHKLTGEDLGLSSNANVHDSITWKLYMWGGDGRAYNFSDVSEFVGQLGLPQLYWWAEHLNRPDWTWDNDRRVEASRGSAGLFHDIESFWYRSVFPQEQPPQLEALRHFTGVDWLTWRGGRTWLAFRSGFNGGNHDNDDLGTFILGFDDERFLCDPGYRANLASQHNCITVRSFEQTDGATARITRLEPQDGGFYLVCDIQEAFPHVLEHYDRHLLLLSDAHLLIIDDVMGRDAASLGVPGRTTVRTYLQSRHPIQTTTQGWQIAGERNVLRIIPLSETGYAHIDAWTHERNRGGPIHRLRWRDAYDRVHSVMITLLTFGDPTYDCEITDQTIRLTLDDKTYTFTHQNHRLTFNGTI